MICLNSAGNLVRSEVGNEKTGPHNPLFPQGASVRRRHVGSSKPCPSSHAGRTGTFLPLREERGGKPVSGMATAQQGQVCTWSHGAGRQARGCQPPATRAQCAGKSLRRWVELRRPSDGRGQRTDLWPQYAFKRSMFNVSCNSH